MQCPWTFKTVVKTGRNRRLYPIISEDLSEMKICTFWWASSFWMLRFLIVNWFHQKDFCLKQDLRTIVVNLSNSSQTSCIVWFSKTANIFHHHTSQMIFRASIARVRLGVLEFMQLHKPFMINANSPLQVKGYQALFNCAFTCQTILGK